MTSLQNKLQKLEQIAREIENCSECQKNKTGKAVSGEGNPNARIVFIGEAPGKEEAKIGRPFIGRSGKLLRSLIKEIGLSEEKVYITSPVKYLPVYGTPRKKDILHGQIHLNKQLEVIDPEIIVLLGNFAVQAVLNEPLIVTREHGKIIEKEGKKYFITLHPAAALRFPPLRKIFISDFEKLKDLIRKENIKQ